jgi:hypothetical protein
MEYWSDGVVEWWSDGVLEWWSIGVVEYWSFGVMEGRRCQVSSKGNSEKANPPEADKYRISNNEYRMSK